MTENGAVPMDVDADDRRPSSSSQEKVVKAVPAKVKFRNYYPRAPGLQAGVMKRITTGEIEEQVDTILKQNTVALDKKEWMAPTAAKKNWDIKRDFHRKLQQLERRTEAALHTLIRQQILQVQGKASAAAFASSGGNTKAGDAKASTGNAKNDSPGTRNGTTADQANGPGSSSASALTAANLRELDSLKPTREDRMLGKQMADAKLENEDSENEEPDFGEDHE